MIKKLFVCLIIAAFFTGCKKGEDDPLISFRTRKARITGKWTRVSGTSITTRGDYYELNYTYTKDSVYIVEINNGRMQSGPGIASKLTIEINKDGSTETTSVYSTSNVSTNKGIWNFTGGVGKTRNKEQLLLQQDLSSFSFVYDIKELRDEKLVLVRKYASGDSNTEEILTYKK